MEQFSVSFTDGYSKKVTFQSANKEVATVSSKGLVTAVDEGKTTITAKTFNGKKAKISCVVIDDQKETATSSPVNTATLSQTIAATASVEPTASTPVLSIETTNVTATPSITPIAAAASSITPIATATNAPAETPTATPVSTSNPTFDTPATGSPVPTEQTTVIPDNTPTVTPVPDIVTTSAIVNKIENGTIYVDKNNTKLQLSDWVRLCKNNYEITMDEIFVGDTITITYPYNGFVSDRHPSVFVGCKKIEVTNSRSRLLPPKTIRDKDEIHLSLYNYPSPLTYEPSKTKVIKNGKEIPFSELNKGDTVRVNYTYHGSDDGTVGFYETLDTIVVLDDEYTDARTVTGVITNIEFDPDDTYYFVKFADGVYFAECTNDTIIKMKNEETEFATDKSSLQIGQTISVSYRHQSYDMLPVWLHDCKIVIDTTVPIATPTVKPTVSPVVPTVTPVQVGTCSAVVSKIEDGVIYVDDNTKRLELTSCVLIYKDNCRITENEIFVGDTITISYEGYIENGRYDILANCDKIEVTQSNSRMVSQATIREFVGSGYIDFYYNLVLPCVDPLRTKIYKNGEEISFEELKEGDTLRIQYTNYKCNGKDDTGGSYDVLDTVVVLDEDITYARKARGVITRIDEGKTGGENYFYVTFCDGNYCAIAEDTTIIKMREDGTEFAIDKARLRAGMTIDVFFEDQSYDLVPTWLYPCKKIVIDTTVSISTPSVNPSDTPAPLVIPTVQPPVKPAKPVIYLYPEKETSVSVDLDFHGSFTYTYPYTKDGHWDVVAKPDGTLTNKVDGKEYSYLFWEGVTSEFTPDFSEGFCVKGEDTTAFLQKVLPKMGLTPKEYNEFIVYWAPLMQNNPYNLISFQTENYEEMAPLHVNPAPDSMFRVYMAYKPLTKPVSIPEQNFTPFERKGFTVVEWGGCMVAE